MPSQTNQDRIRELEREVAKLTERVDNLRRDIDRIVELSNKRSDRRWSLTIALIGLFGGVVGGILPDLTKLIVARFFR